MWLYIIVKVSLYFNLPDFFWLFNATYWTILYFYQKYIPYIEIKDNLLIKNIGYKKVIDLNEVVRMENYLNEVKLITPKKSILINGDRMLFEDYAKLRTLISSSIQLNKSTDSTFD